MILKSICYVVYQLIGRYLPDNDGRITLGSTFIRRLLVKGFTGSKSHGLYINKNATISPTLVISRCSKLIAYINLINQCNAFKWILNTYL